MFPTIDLTLASTLPGLVWCVFLLSILIFPPRLRSMFKKAQL
jgi:hypothetical protein